MRPPVGVKPLRIYALPRIQELSRAIYDYALYAEDKGTMIETISLLNRWAGELKDILSRMENEELKIR